MCYVSPGPRCTPHARIKMNTAKSKVRLLSERLAQITSEISACTEDQDKTEVEDLRTKQATTMTDLRNARMRAKEALREFASTKGGRSEIQERLEAAKQSNDFVKVKHYERVLKEGAVIAGWRENALIKMREDGRLPISKARMYRSDGSYRFYPDDMGISTDATNVGGDIQVGDTHSVRFESADRLVQVTPMAYAVALDSQGEPLSYERRGEATSWSYQVATDRVAYANAQERHRNGSSMYEDDVRENHYDERFSSLEDADAAALDYIQTMDAGRFTWHPTA